MRSLSEERYLADLFTKDSIQASFMQHIITSINNVARGAGVAVTGDALPPPPVDGISVKTSGEMVHATLSHTATLTRAVEYHLEADTSPSFTQPHVMHLGSSRGHIFTLPSKTDSGAAQNWYLRAYSQYPGSPPSKPTFYGGLSPTPLKLSGSTQLTLLPSTGSGTASTTGQQGGSA